MPLVASLCLLGLILAACQPPGDAPLVVKIGVIAPFEGIGRRLGYAILPAIESELAASNQTGALSRYRVVLVALNDDLDAGSAVLQARALAQDPEVQAVIGLWSSDAAQAAVPILADAGVPVLLPVPDEGFGAGSLSLCPSPEELAAMLLGVAKPETHGGIVLAGPDNALRRALLTRDPELTVIRDSSPLPCTDGGASHCAVVYTGDAVGASEVLQRWKASGWEGVLLGGPETARPWLIQLAEGSSEGTRATVCGGRPASSGNQDVSLQNAAGQATTASRLILSGLARVIAEQGSPSRGALSQGLPSEVVESTATWLEVRNGRWVPLRE